MYKRVEGKEHGEKEKTGMKVTSFFGKGGKEEGNHCLSLVGKKKRSLLIKGEKVMAMTLTMEKEGTERHSKSS